MISEHFDSWYAAAGNEGFSLNMWRERERILNYGELMSGIQNSVPISIKNKQTKKL